MNEQAKEELSLEEVIELESALDCPVFDDEKNVSDWAEDEVDAMATAGIMNGDENREFNPQQYLRRSECAKIISSYIIFDSRPKIIFPGGSYIEYLGDEPEEIEFTENELLALGITPDKLENLDGVNMHGASIHDERFRWEDSESDVSLLWAKDSHVDITYHAFEMLKQNTGEGGRAYIYNKMSEMVGPPTSREVQPGRIWVRYFAWYTDTIESDRNIISDLFRKKGFYLGHFYDPDVGRSYSPLNDHKKINAYWRFNDHFYNAYTSYLDGCKYAAYRELGMSIHYLEDLNNPYHASNRTVVDSKHGQYEDWVNNNVLKECGGTAMTYASYRYTYDSTFIEMANNFAGLAKAGFSICDRFDNSSGESAAIKETKKDIERTKRAVCGILNRFYYTGQLNH